MNVSVLNGTTLQLQCAAGGYPIPAINWMYNDSLLTNSSLILIDNTINSSINIVSSTLTVSVIQFASRGDYTCIASSNDSTNYTEPATVAVVGELYCIPLCICVV